MKIQRLAALSALAFAASLATAPAMAQSQPVIGLITKTETNPFFVKMKEGAEAEAKKLGAKLMTAAGVQVIALDSPVDGADALFATDNYKAGVLIGEYAKAALGGKAAKIVTLDLFPGHPVGAQRHNGFLKGMGLAAPDAKSNELGGKAAGVVCMADSFGDAAKGQTGMENCLQKDPGVNVVYTINEPAAAGAYNALKKAGKDKDVVIVSVDGGCAGVKDVTAGKIAATSQQYPLKMASMGVAAGVEYAKNGKKASGYVDTGVTLIAKSSVKGVQSTDDKMGLDMCWGNK
jgi:fructose transport system substrate-binding protein